MKELLMIVNEDRFFLSHRKDIALAAQKDGWDVTIVCKDTGQRQDVEALGLRMMELPINPTGTDIRQEFKTFLFLLKLYRRHKEAIVHHVGMKLILWGGLAAKLAGIRGVVNAVSGLGVMFSTDHLSFMAKGILWIVRFSHHRKNIKDIFQNDEDKQLFLQNYIINEQDSVYIKGSGIDLRTYTYEPQPSDAVIRILFTARMLKEKGVLVLIKAANILRKDYKDRVEFLLCGGLSNNPKAIQKNELEQMCDGRYIQWLGFRSDVRELLVNSHIMAFPSYYREGVPKSLIEACATGRPIVTTNSIGCKDTVDDGSNGFLTPPQDATALAEKLRILIEHPEIREEMGKNGRAKAEREFSLDDVIRKHLDIYHSL
ncbi:MAG: glycosyltransferase family 4 protein [Prevotella sp.]|nr:glycosyltransferase family 4 protein [Prevotella sp.]